MAKYDHGGGCSCGLNAECNCGSNTGVETRRLSPIEQLAARAASPAKPAKSATLPTDAAIRKGAPIARGVIDYFPDAMFEVAKLSKVGNDQHNPGKPMHWAKEKSTDHADCIVRHLIDRGTRDEDGVRHSAKVAWRALALLQTEIDQERGLQPHYETDRTFYS